jgi:dihydroxyacetone kinase
VQVDVQRLYVGNLMTALDMAGFSLSLLQLDDMRRQRLDAVTQVLM